MTTLKTMQEQKTELSTPRGLRLGAIVFGLGFAFLLLGCGRPATEEECREILRKSARFELEDQLGKDSTLIDAELKTIEEELNGSLLEQCVGKRIRESELACIRNAQTAKELFEDCQ